MASTDSPVGPSVTVTVTVPDPRRQEAPMVTVSRSRPETWRLEVRLGYSWRDQSLLRLALAPAPHDDDGRSRLDNNERLEFLGDSVLDLAVGLWLFERHADRREGFMAQRRAELVCASALEAHAVRLGIGDHLPGRRAGRQARADALEAIVGALYLDCGRRLSVVTERLEAWGVLHG